MRTNKLLSLIIVLGMGFSACYDENDIHTTKGDIPYELKEGGDAVDQYIYKFYIQILIQPFNFILFYIIIFVYKNLFFYNNTRV